MCKVLQNRKNCSFYTFWEKKTPGCKIMHLCTITTVIVHICTVTVAVLSFFFFFLSLLELSNSLSPTLQCQEEEKEEADHHN